MKKNIWLINYYSYPPGRSSWRRHFDLGKLLVKDGYSLNIIGGSFVHDRKEHILNKSEKYRIEEYEGVKYHILNGISYSGNFKRILSMIEFMIKVFFYEKKIKEKPEVIYCSCPHPFNGLISWYLSKKYKAKFILEIRDLWPETWVEMGAITKKSIIYKIFAWIEKFLYKKADKIVTLMPGAFLYIEKLGILKDKIEWISNGVDLEKFDEDSEKEPIYKFDKDKINFLYTGSIGIANALDEIFEVAKLLKEDREIVFNFIGDGPLKEKYIRFCEENKLDNIRFYPVVSKDNIPSLLKQADILMTFVKKSNLYKYGISPNKLFEYLASSRPVLFSGEVYNDIIKIANAGISVVPENAEKLKVGILELKNINNSNLGKNGRYYLEENFTNIVLEKKLKKIIEGNEQWNLHI